jgi:hypothetical protein
MFQFVQIFVFNKRWFVARLLVCYKSPSWRLHISPHKGLGGYMYVYLTLGVGADLPAVA